MLRFALLVIFSTATFALAGPINPRVTMAARQIVPRRAPETTTTVLTAPSIEPTGTPKPPAENGDVKLWGLTDVVVPVNLADKPKTGKICLPKHAIQFGCLKQGNGLIDLIYRCETGTGDDRWQLEKECGENTSCHGTDDTAEHYECKKV